MKINLKAFNFLKNRYALTALVFVAWIAFFDQNNLITQIQYRLQLNQLEKEKAFYQGEIKGIQKDMNELQQNPKSLEKFAREKYMMKKDDEEIFVIVDKSGEIK